MKNTSTKNDDKTRIMMRAAALCMEGPYTRRWRIRAELLPIACFVLGVILGLLL